MTTRPKQIERKAVLVARYIARNPDWPSKIARGQAIKDWKGRKGNLTGRIHPSVKIGWPGWLSITAKRRARLLERIAAWNTRHGEQA